MELQPVSEDQDNGIIADDNSLRTTSAEAATAACLSEDKIL